MPQYPTINSNTADQQALVVKPSIMSDEIHWEVSIFTGRCLAVCVTGKAANGNVSLSQALAILPQIDEFFAIMTLTSRGWPDRAEQVDAAYRG